MTRRPLAPVSLAGILVLLGLGRTQAAEPQPPDAVHVIARGVTSLDQALAIATESAFQGKKPRPIALVIDATPYTADKADLIFGAVRDVTSKAGERVTWQVARLGGKAGGPGASLNEIASAVGDAISTDRTPEVRSTLAALDATIRSVKGADPVVVYLADWHFEDDARLERFIERLARRGVTLSVIGSEAAFGRGWTDGIRESEDRRRDHAQGIPVRDYWEGVGRSPFTADDDEAPWHGGDTAYPHAPYRWWDYLWETAFSETEYRNMADSRWAGEEPEDVNERLGGKDESPPERDMDTPLPSSWGPYGLMRAVGVTGGRYVLWSWNPTGRQRVRYEFARCNLFPPDLRSRKDILAGVRKDPYARAMVLAWHQLLGARRIILEHTPPLAENTKTPVPQEWVTWEGDFWPTWDTEAKQHQFIQAAQRAVAVLSDAMGVLDAAIGDGSAPDDPISRRLQADALLMRHVVRVSRFELTEALTAAREVPYAEHKEKAARAGGDPAIRTHLWINDGRNADEIETRDKPPYNNPPPYDAEGGAAVMRERRELLLRFRGTPFGEQIAFNGVYTWRPGIYVWTPGTEAGKTPGESTDPGVPTGPGGGSTGGGPATGK